MRSLSPARSWELPRPGCGTSCWPRVPRVVGGSADAGTDCRLVGSTRAPDRERREPQPPAPATRPTPRIVGLMARVDPRRRRRSRRRRGRAGDRDCRAGHLGVLLEGDAAVLRALDHLLQRVAQQQGLGRVILNCQGYREWRDESLRKKALALAEEVLRDGQGRTTGPLNSYERRVVHLAIEAVGGVTTWSVGEGGERRVTVAPRRGPRGTGVAASDGAVGNTDPLSCSRRSTSGHGGVGRLPRPSGRLVPASQSDGCQNPGRARGAPGPRRASGGQPAPGHDAARHRLRQWLARPGVRPASPPAQGHAAGTATETMGVPAGGGAGGRSRRPRPPPPA